MVDHDPAADARAFEPVVVAVEAFTPEVEIVRPGVCAVATRGPSRDFGGDDALVGLVAAAVDGALPEGAPACRVGVADGPFAAERAARRRRRRAGGGERGVPRRVPGVDAGASTWPTCWCASASAPWASWLAAGPAVLARFGPAGAAAHRLARGLDERPLSARVPPLDLTVVAELDPPADRLETAAFVAKGLADRLHEGLTVQGLTATRVLVEAEWEHGERMGRRWRLDGNGGRGAAALAERVRWQLDGWMTRWPSGRRGA